jgi:hypothetical protein
MSDKQQESDQNDWESEGGAYTPEPNEETPNEQIRLAPTQNSIFAALRKIAKPKKG